MQSPRCTRPSGEPAGVKMVSHGVSASSRRIVSIDMGWQVLHNVHRHHWRLLQVHHSWPSQKHEARFPGANLPGDRVDEVHWLDHPRYQVRGSTSTSLCHVSHTCLYYALQQRQLPQVRHLWNIPADYNSTHDESHLNLQISGKRVICHSSRNSASMQILTRYQLDYK